MRKLTLIFFVILISQVVLAQVTINMKRENGVSILPCKVNGLNLKFIFDTGASDVSISMTEATFMLKNDYLSPDDIIGKSNYRDANGNISEGVNINLRELEIGGLKLYNVKASVVTNIKAPLLLGQTAISKLGIVQLDLEANTLTILPRENLSDVKNAKDSIKVSAQEDTLQEKTKEEVLTDMAFQLFYDQQFQEAISKFDIILRDNPRNVEALFFRAISYDLLEDYKTAIKEYTKVIELDPKHDKAYAYRGKSKYDIGDYNGSLLDLNKGLNINPKLIKGFVWRSDTRLKLNNLSGAISDYDNAISISPIDSSLYIERAFLKHKIKDYKGALVDCNRAISINEEYAYAYFCRGVTKNLLNDFAAAMEDLDKAIELDSELASAYGVRGGIKEDRYEDYDGAMEDYDRAIEIDKEYLYALIRKSGLENKIKDNVWIKTCTSKDGDVWYVYKEVVSKESAVIKIWVKTEFKSLNVYKNGKNITVTNGHRLTLCLINCRDKESKFLNVRVYNSKGDVVSDIEYEEYEAWKTPAPQTILETIILKVCELYN